jgi:hypothetical protein
MWQDLSPEERSATGARLRKERYQADAQAAQDELSNGETREKYVRQYVQSLSSLVCGSTCRH